MLTKAQLQAALDACDDRRERLAYENATLRSDLESLHKRIRGLAVDCGAVQTEDAVEDVRRAVERLAKFEDEAMLSRVYLHVWADDRGLRHVTHYSSPATDEDYAAVRAAARKGE